MQHNIIRFASIFGIRNGRVAVVWLARQLGAGRECARVARMAVYISERRPILL
jgi:hypothetical protein